MGIFNETTRHLIVEELLKQYHQNPIEYGKALTEALNSLSSDEKKDIERLISQYKNKEVQWSDEDDLREKLGHDLEMLEFSPNVVAALIPHLIKKIVEK